MNCFNKVINRKAAFKVLAQSKGDAATALVIAAAQTAVWHEALQRSRRDRAVENEIAGGIALRLFEHLSTRKRRYSSAQLKSLLRLVASSVQEYSYSSILFGAIAILRAHRDVLAIDNEVRDDFGAVRVPLQKFNYDGRYRSLARFVDEMTGQNASLRFQGLGAAEIAMNATLDEAKMAWKAAVLDHAVECNPIKPSRHWMAQREALLPSAEIDVFAALAQRLFQVVIDCDGLAREPDDYRHLTSNIALLVGLIWLGASLKSDKILSNIADLAEIHSKGKGYERARMFPITSACCRALAWSDTPASLAQLSRLELRIRWPKARKLVRKLFDEAVAESGLCKDDVVESLVPDFALQDGKAEISFGDCIACLSLETSDKPSISWRLSDGHVTSRPPTALKTEHPDAVSRVKQMVNDIEKMRAAQRTRLDLLFRRERIWPMKLWRQRYLENGLISSLARRLIWEVDATPVVWHEGLLCSVEGRELGFADTAEVRLWHPISHSVEDVVAWRNRLTDWDVSQPFKQAHREVYPLTEAERRTRTYSNRFAAHILRSGAMLAITQVRGWKAGLFGGSNSSPSLVFPDLRLRAEWWLQTAGDAYTPYGAPVHLATDQVRFYREGDIEPLPLDQVPPLVFSEVMRDVDLFVGVASVGNDPNWQDGGPQGRYRDYWHSYSFGDLNATAQTRKSVLERLVPRLKIAERCRLEDRFLIVRGDVRSYKIHLGSGNILMMPNDQYLCIVPDARARAKDEQVFLPFEGDAVLSIILSKAFLLAGDAAIKDPTIVQQIRSR